jgi:hypothetical protein
VLEELLEELTLLDRADDLDELLLVLDVRELELFELELGDEAVELEPPDVELHPSNWMVNLPVLRLTVIVPIPVRPSLIEKSNQDTCIPPLRTEVRQSTTESVSRIWLLFTGSKNITVPKFWPLAAPFAGTCMVPLTPVMPKGDKLAEPGGIV